MRSEYRIQLTVSNMNYNKKNSKAILYHINMSRRYFFLRQLKIEFYFLHELNKGVLTSLDSINDGSIQTLVRE